MMKSSCGKLLVISGPSGSGKDTVVKRLAQLNCNIGVCVSATSRAMRPGEIDGVDYFFLTRDEFERRIQNGEILEHTQYVGNLYGTPKSQVDDILAAGKSAVFIIEVEGAFNIKRMYKDALLVFLMPPSVEELEKRLRTRKTDDDAAIEARLYRAKEEMKYAQDYDYILINDDAQRCACELNDILNSGCR